MPTYIPGCTTPTHLMTEQEIDAAIDANHQRLLAERNPLAPLLINGMALHRKELALKREREARLAAEARAKVERGRVIDFARTEAMRRDAWFAHLISEATRADSDETLMQTFLRIPANGYPPGVQPTTFYIGEQECAAPESAAEEPLTRADNPLVQELRAQGYQIA